jgi:hypothetical protein
MAIGKKGVWKHVNRQIRPGECSEYARLERKPGD